jgi:hypothetical protein
MKPIPTDLYAKIERVSETVRKGFLNKGIVIPVKNRDGSINLGRFKVVNQHNGFYAIYDQQGESIVDQINLPQTAALIANDLALNRWLDKQLLDQDRQYGYALFEETLYKQRLTKKNQPLDLFEIALSRNTTLKRKRENYERDIIKKFEKLRKLT